MAKNDHIQRALEKIAQQEGISVELVRREIDAAIEAGLHCSEPEAQAFWRQVPRRGAQPTADELIAFICELC